MFTFTLQLSLFKRLKYGVSTFAVGFLLLLLLLLSQLFAHHAYASQTLQQKLAELNEFQAQFTQVVKDADGEIVHQAEGSLAMQRPDRLRWQTLFPDESLMIADGKSVYNIDDFVEQVTILSQQQAIQGNPFVLLTSNNEDNWSQFTVTELVANQTYTVAANDEQSQIVSLTLEFTGDTLVSLTTLDGQGQTSHLSFADIKMNQAPANDLFKPTFPASYTVDDQR